MARFKRLRAPVSVDLHVGRPEEFPAARDFAYTDPNYRPLRIVVAPKLETQAVARIDGILMHEFGHAALLAQGFFDHSERDADKAAKALFGCRLSYDSDDVQTTGPGVSPRPRHLPA